MTEQAASPPAGGTTPPEQPQDPAPETEPDVPATPRVPAQRSGEGAGSGAGGGVAGGTADEAATGSSATGDATPRDGSETAQDGPAATEARETVPAVEGVGPAPASDTDPTEGMGPAPSGGDTEPTEGMGPAPDTEPTEGMGPAAGGEGHPDEDEEEPAPGRSRAGGVVKILVGVVVGCVLVVGGAFGWRLLSGTTDSTAVGDCLAGKSSADIRPVKCDDPEAEHKVVGKLDNKKESDLNPNVCAAYPTTVSGFWKGHKGGNGYILCLEPIKKEPTGK